MDENEVKLIRNIIQDIINEVRKNNPVGQTETARIIITELDNYRTSKNIVYTGYQPKQDNNIINPPCGNGSQKKGSV
jgi:hypothetical protein